MVAEKDETKTNVILTVAESKRLIAKGIAAHPVVGATMMKVRELREIIEKGGR